MINAINNTDTTIILTNVNDRFSSSMTLPDFLANNWNAKENTSKKAICFKLFKYLSIGTLERIIITRINANKEPNKIKSPNGIINVIIINKTNINRWFFNCFI